MSKPDWKDAPAWANWFAMDPFGSWYWWQHMPNCHQGEWLTESFLQGSQVLHAGDFQTDVHWSETLEERHVSSVSDAARYRKLQR